MVVIVAEVVKDGRGRERDRDSITIKVPYINNWYWDSDKSILYNKKFNSETNKFDKIGKWKYDGINFINSNSDKIYDLSTLYKNENNKIIINIKEIYVILKEIFNKDERITDYSNEIMILLFKKHNSDKEFVSDDISKSKTKGGSKVNIFNELQEYKGKGGGDKTNTDFDWADEAEENVYGRDRNPSNDPLWTKITLNLLLDDNPNDIASRTTFKKIYRKI